MAKILVYAPYYPPHLGGLENYALELNTHLLELGHSVTVFTPNLPIQPSSKGISSNITVIRYPAFELVSNFPAPKFWSLEFWRLWQGVVHDNPQVIITHTRFFLSSILGLAHSKIRRAPWIHVEHGSWYVMVANPFTSFCARIYDEILGRLVLKNSSQNVAISKAVQRFIARFEKRPSTVIYRGLEFEEVDKISPFLPREVLAENKIVLCTVCRLYKWKGVQQAIAAVNALPEQIKNKMIYLIIGDGEDYEALKNLANPPVYLVGKKSRDEAVGIMKQADIYIHPSRKGGGLATSLIEAMYCECAVIATPNEGADEVVINNQTGILVNDNSPKEITLAIEQLIADMNTAKDMGKRAKLRVKEMFSWQSNAWCFNEIIQKILKKR